jgi:hypothetical protein
MSHEGENLKQQVWHALTAEEVLDHLKVEETRRRGAGCLEEACCARRASVT